MSQCSCVPCSTFPMCTGPVPHTVKPYPCFPFCITTYHQNK